MMVEPGPSHHPRTDLVYLIFFLPSRQLQASHVGRGWQAMGEILATKRQLKYSVQKVRMDRLFLVSELENQPTK